MINPVAEKSAADKQIREVRIKTAAREAPATSLSGGNQQKIVIGNGSTMGPIFTSLTSRPSASMSVPKGEIYSFLPAAEERRGIILISSYLPEVYDLSDTCTSFAAGDWSSYDSAHTSEKALHETILTQALGV